MTQILNIKQVCLYYQDKSLYHLVLRIETDETIRKINNAKYHLKSKQSRFSKQKDLLNIIDFGNSF